MKARWCAIFAFLVFCIGSGPSVSAQGIGIDCPGDTTVAAGTAFNPSPLLVTNATSRYNVILSFFVCDNMHWGSHACVAGFSWSALQPGGSFNIFGDSYSSYRIAPPVDAPYGSATEVKVIARTFEDSSPCPVLSITEATHGTWQFQDMSGVLARIFITPGTELNFSWSADASDHGALIAGYKYGWDPADILNDDDWDVMFDPGCVSAPPKVWYSGVHQIFVLVVDDTGAFALGVIEADVVPGLEAAQVAPAKPSLSTIPPTRAHAASADEAICIFRVIASHPTATQESSWSAIKSLYRVDLK
jgi:hypothetical protein